MKTQLMKTTAGETYFKCTLGNLVTIGETRTDAMCHMMKILRDRKNRVVGTI